MFLLKIELLLSLLLSFCHAMETFWLHLMPKTKCNLGGWGRQTRYKGAYLRSVRRKEIQEIAHPVPDWCLYSEAWILSLSVFHHFLYLSHLDTSDSLFECSVASSREGKDERQRLGQCLSLLCFHDISVLQDPVVMIQECQFCLAVGAEVHIITYIPFCVSCCWLPTLVCCSLCTATLLVLIPRFGTLSIMIWLRDTSKQARDRTDSLPCPENLSGFRSTRVIPFYSRCEGKQENGLYLEFEFFCLSCSLKCS